MAIGRPTVIGPELKEGTLVPVFESHSGVRSSCCRIATSPARRKPEVRAFRGWILGQRAPGRGPPVLDPTNRSQPSVNFASCHRSRLVGSGSPRRGDEDGCGIVHRIGNSVDEDRTPKPRAEALSAGSDHLERPRVREDVGRHPVPLVSGDCPARPHRSTDVVARGDQKTLSG